MRVDALEVTDFATYQLLAQEARAEANRDRKARRRSKRLNPASLGGNLPTDTESMVAMRQFPYPLKESERPWVDRAVAQAVGFHNAAKHHGVRFTGAWQRY